MKPSVIAIDGPAGSGKSTIGHALAEYLGYTMLDSGLLYRLVARQILENVSQDSQTDESFITETAKKTLQDLTIEPSAAGPRLIFRDKLLTDLNLHSDEISAFVPLVGRVADVRVWIREIQLKFTAAGNAILAGRDIGTVVAPNAELKLYLDVSIDERVARRQWSQNQLSTASRSTIESALSERDRLDRDRIVSPLQVATDAVVFRTDKLSVSETVAYIIQMCDLPSPPSRKTDLAVRIGQALQETGGNPNLIYASTKNAEISGHRVNGRRAEYVVGGYVVDEERVLLMWHSQLGRWVPCGGRIQISRGEYPHEAVAREVQAECGLEVEIQDPVGMGRSDGVSSSVPAPVAMQEIRLNSENYYLDMAYFCRIVGGSLELDYKQARAYHWFSPRDLESYPLLPHVRLLASRAIQHAP